MVAFKLDALCAAGGQRRESNASARISFITRSYDPRMRSRRQPGARSQRPRRSMTLGSGSGLVTATERPAAFA